MIVSIHPPSFAQTTYTRLPRLRFSQVLTSHNAFYLEYSPGRGGISVNYDYRFTDNFAARIGAGTFFYRGETPHFFPITGNYLLNEESHNIQIGAGIIALDGGGANWLLTRVRRRFFNNIPPPPPPTGGSDVIFTANMGYRYQPKHGGIMGEVGLTFMGAIDVDPAGLFNISLGYAF